MARYEVADTDILRKAYDGLSNAGAIHTELVGIVLGFIVKIGKAGDSHESRTSSCSISNHVLRHKSISDGDGA